MELVPKSRLHVDLEIGPSAEWRRYEVGYTRKRQGRSHRLSVGAIGVFPPCYLFVVIPAPYFRHTAKNRQVKAFVDGVTAAATGAIAGAAFVLGRRAIVDIPTVLITVTSFALLSWVKRVPEPLVILGAGVIGFVVHSYHA
jgi:chromate transporter